MNALSLHEMILTHKKRLAVLLSVREAIPHKYFVHKAVLLI
uniref:Uncharacterized protein n=1 Tax=Podoviridae sp. ctrTt13 TaxID=2825279 RepID=A0A8S5NUH4_9CAUD|nr:MAG TPA: hypothetical protein [Podoviridae sp. ctrTt13]